MLALVTEGVAAEAEAPHAELHFLCDEYKKYELPYPEEDWPLVKVGKLPKYRLGFLVAMPKDRKRGKVLLGTGIHEFKTSAEVELVEADPKLVENDNYIVAGGVRATIWSANLALACQCQERGWNDFAEAVLQCERSIAPANRDALIMMARQHYFRRLAAPDADRKKIAELYERLPYVPYIHTTRKHAEREAKALSRDLLATITPSKRSSKQEELIDKLLEWKGYSVDDLKQDALLAELSAPAMVPYLVRHLNDRRMTRSSRTIGLFGTSTTILRVGDVAARILAEEHAGKAEVESWRKFDGNDKVVDMAKANAWLKEWGSTD